MIAIVDYGMGNLRSVSKALESLGAFVEVTSRAEAVAAAERVILPGQGAFGDAVKELHAAGLWQPVLDHIAAGKPYLGICLGLQLLMEGSEEAPDVAGLGVLRGQCRLLKVSGKVPHMGWNALDIKNNCPLFADLDESPYFYFAHSYYAEPDEPSVVSATTDYEIEIPVAVWHGSLAAVQFHPEKSQQVGLKVLQNFLDWNGKAQ